MLLLSCFQFLKAQGITTRFGMLGKIHLTLGNQNQQIEAGLFLFGTLNYNDAAFESGMNLISGQLFKRHTIRQSGMYYGYEFFALAGIGKNSNFLGSTVSNFANALLVNPYGKGGFNGLGFGFQKEYLPNALQHFNLRRGKLLMRFSNANHSLDLAFLNDFKFGRLFNGEGTDFGSTGSIQLGYTAIQSVSQSYRAGMGVALFTPKPDYTKTPNNPVNSDDGRKNVWYTVKPFEHTFYANLYGFGTYQGRDTSFHAKLGMNSQKLGAYIQNVLHDGPGLNPRFPWNVTENDRVFIEVSAGLIKTEVYE